MRKMGLSAIYPKPKLSQKDAAHSKYLYLQANIMTVCSTQVWSTDITYICFQQGFLYLVAMLDWYSRYVLSWRLNNSLETFFCIEALEEALEKGSTSCPSEG